MTTEDQADRWKVAFGALVLHVWKSGSSDLGPSTFLCQMSTGSSRKAATQRVVLRATTATGRSIQRFMGQDKFRLAENFVRLLRNGISI
jgi:hypothetical protein